MLTRKSNNYIPLQYPTSPPSGCKRLRAERPAGWINNHCNQERLHAYRCDHVVLCCLLSCLTFSGVKDVEKSHGCPLSVKNIGCLKTMFQRGFQCWPRQLNEIAWAPKAFGKSQWFSMHPVESAECVYMPAPETILTSNLRCMDGNSN